MNANADYWKDKAKFEGDLGKIFGVQWRDFNGVDQIKELIALPGDTDVILKINNDKVSHQYKLNKKRKINQKIISQLKNVGVTLKIH